MSKSKVRKLPRDYEDWNEDYGHDPKSWEKKKQKKLVNVLRSKDVNKLMELEDGDDD